MTASTTTSADPVPAILTTPRHFGLEEIVDLALQEDIGTGDVTTLATVLADRMATGVMLAKQDGVIFIPAALAETAISRAEFTNLQDAFNFELNKQGKNGAEFEGGWNATKFAAFKTWIDAHPEKLKMPRAEFDEILAEHQRPRPQGGRGGRGPQQ